MKVYIISGLGADHRAFQKLKMPEGFEPVHIKWIKPDKREAVQGYAQRLSASINTAEPFILLGLSFGGLIAGEMAKTLQPQLTILLSTMKTTRQMPGLYRFVYTIGFHKILPYQLFKKGNMFTYFAFGVKDKSDKKVLDAILKDTDKKFLEWAVSALLQWKNDDPAKNICHIHGTRDRLIPIKKPLPDELVPLGGHLMVLTKSEDVNKIISEKLMAIKM